MGGHRTEERWSVGARVVAVDWSGDARAEVGAHPKLWLAEVVDGELVRLEPSSRQGVVDELRTLAELGDALLVGLDFSFSYPAWFLDQLGVGTVEELWTTIDAVDLEAPPFYGWAGSTAPAAEQRFRRTEEAARADGLPVKSTFQVRGPGSVGTGSWRGMARLAELAAAGFAAWPFDQPAAGAPTVAEVYPRAFLPAAVVKSRPADRAQAWDERWPEVGGHLRDRALGTEDAFDAAVAALGLSALVTGVGGASPALAPPADALAAREGWILRPPV